MSESQGITRQEYITQLEQENGTLKNQLAEAIAKRDKYRDQYFTLRVDIDTALKRANTIWGGKVIDDTLAERDEMRKDVERLNWLDDRSGCYNWQFQSQPNGKTLAMINYPKGIRQAVDAAITTIRLAQDTFVVAENTRRMDEAAMATKTQGGGL